MLLSNKVWGGIVGILPGINLALKKYVINKNAAKKLGEIYGIDLKFIDEKENNIINNIPKPVYIIANKNKENLNMEIKRSKSIKESTSKSLESNSNEKSPTKNVGDGNDSSTLKVILGSVVGALRNYITTLYCEDLINKFEEYYIKNAQILENSYKKAAEYLLSKCK